MQANKSIKWEGRLEIGWIWDEFDGKVGFSQDSLYEILLKMIKYVTFKRSLFHCQNTILMIKQFARRLM